MPTDWSTLSIYMRSTLCLHPQAQLYAVWMFWKEFRCSHYLCYVEYVSIWFFLTMYYLHYTFEFFFTNCKALNRLNNAKKAYTTENRIKWNKIKSNKMFHKSVIIHNETIFRDKSLCRCLGVYWMLLPTLPTTVACLNKLINTYLNHWPLISSCQYFIE